MSSRCGKVIFGFGWLFGMLLRIVWVYGIINNLQTKDIHTLSNRIMAISAANAATTESSAGGKWWLESPTVVRAQTSMTKTPTPAMSPAKESLIDNSAGDQWWLEPAPTPVIQAPISASTAQSCLAPPQPPNGERKLSCLDDFFAGGEPECEVPEGKELGLNATLIYSCNPGFTIRGVTEVFCRSPGNWSQNFPICIADSCILPDGSNGTCEPVHDCPPVSTGSKIPASTDSQCGFSEDLPIICCPKLNSGDGRGVIARQKCTEYTGHQNTLTCPSVVSNNNVPTGVPKRLGKTPVKGMEFPHMAALGFDLSNGKIHWQCGGTLISESFVLTSAVCTSLELFGNATWVRVGDLNLKQFDDGDQSKQRRVAEITRHPNYIDGQGYNDIGLLRLESPVRFDSWIRPACLHTLPTVEINEATATAIATGWGKLKEDDVYQADLMKVLLPLIDAEICREYYPSVSFLPHGIAVDQTICAGSIGKDTCSGDAGSPLVIERKSGSCTYDVVGIVSIGSTICGSGIPTLFTRVYHYLPWIESIVWSEL